MMKDLEQGREEKKKAKWEKWGKLKRKENVLEKAMALTVDICV